MNYEFSTQNLFQHVLALFITQIEQKKPSFGLFRL